MEGSQDALGDRHGRRGGGGVDGRVYSGIGMRNFAGLGCGQLLLMSDVCFGAKADETAVLRRV